MALRLVTSETISSPVSTLAFTGIGSAYRGYEFHFYNVHPSAGDDPNGYFSFLCNETAITSSAFGAQHNEDDDEAIIFERPENDQHSAAGIHQLITMSTGADDEDGVCGTLKLYDPAAAFPTQFIARTVSRTSDGTDDYAQDFRVSGYIDSTNPVTSVTFRFNTNAVVASGNIDSGIIKLFGVK
tara:strand:+ start:838 stop:1389 length:552 start_codon:yes stop_codon:yes gene_type:complete